jgi:serine/threonine protein kinase
MARKILRVSGVTLETVEHEVQVMKKLCGPNTHINIIQLLNDGPLPGSLYYFIDMEVCDLTLKAYIQRATLPRPSDSLPYFVRDAGVDVTVLQVWNIMRQIASGIEYIHSQDHVHRDIKPANSMSSTLKS